MKIAVVSDDGITISAHLGRAAYFVMFTIEGGLITDRQLIQKENFHQQGGGHHEHHKQADLLQIQEQGHGMDAHSQDKHRAMFSAVEGCEAVIARGMGMGAFRNLQQLGIKPVLTELHDIQEAIAAYIAGELIERPERVH